MGTVGGFFSGAGTMVPSLTKSIYTDLQNICVCCKLLRIQRTLYRIYHPSFLEKKGRTKELHQRIPGPGTLPKSAITRWNGSLKLAWIAVTRQVLQRIALCNTVILTFPDRFHETDSQKVELFFSPATESWVTNKFQDEISACNTPYETRLPAVIKRYKNHTLWRQLGNRNCQVLLLQPPLVPDGGTNFNK